MVKNCEKCGHEVFHLVCACTKMEYWHRKGGKAYFKKKCKRCRRTINSPGRKGIEPRHVHWEMCGPCRHNEWVARTGVYAPLSDWALHQRDVDLRQGKPSSADHSGNETRECESKDEP